MEKKLLGKTFRNTIIVAVYIFLVSLVMNFGSSWFGAEDNFLTPFVVLLLFSLSAAVVGGLIFGQSVFLFFDNKKKESITAAIYSVGWLGLYTILGMLVLVLLKNYL